jgi:tRNA threonylcarbamoyladenosine biosynthesis protein TsaB
MERFGEVSALLAKDNGAMASCSLNLLSFDTSTEIMSVAVQRSAAGLRQIWQHSGAGGAQTSATLIPAIQDLMAQAQLQLGQLDAVVFGRGPGSFTGLRTACSVAQGLAFGAGIKVLPIDTLLAVAEEARGQQAALLDHWQVLSLLDARMNEMYAGRYEFHRGQWTRIEDCHLMRPEDLITQEDEALAGNVFASYATRLPAKLAQRIDATPTASALLRLAPALLAAGAALEPELALPLYIRDKVAQTTLERAALKAAL